MGNVTKALLVVLFNFAIFHAFSQSFFEGFESGNLNDWEILLGEADLNNIYFVQGLSSVRMFDNQIGEEEVILRHRNFNDNFGIYEVWLLGDQINSDANFYFQFIDQNNYYQISHKPSNSDNPELRLFKMVNGIYSDLAVLAPIADTSEWVKITIERNCAGSIIVFANDAEVVDIIDNDILSPGSIGLGAWDQNSYADILSFFPHQELINNLDTTICEGNSLMIGSSLYTTPGVYLDTLQSTNGCDSIVRTFLSVFRTEVERNNIAFCAGDTILLAGKKYYQSGTFMDTILTNSGCDSILEINVEVFPNNTNEMFVELCPGDSVRVARRWIKEPGSYNFRIFTSEFCDSLILLTVVESNPTVDLGPDRKTCPGELTILNPGTYNSYQWSTGDTTSSLGVLDTGTYSVTVTNDLNCPAEDVIYFSKDCATVTYSPNIFSPNGDGLNEEWKLLFNEPPDQFEVMIFDRWGNLLFESTNYDEGWDGKHNGEILNPAVFAYIAIVDGIQMVGDLTLVR